MVDLIKDIATLTTIPENSLEKLAEKAVFCISSGVEETILKQESIVEVDLGFGTLNIELKTDTVRYKFIPNEKLENAIIDTVVNKRNLLQDKLEKTLVDRVVGTYKDLI